MNLEGWNNNKSLPQKTPLDKKWSRESMIFEINQLRQLDISLTDLIEDLNDGTLSNSGWARGLVGYSNWSKTEIIDLLNTLNQKF